MALDKIDRDFGRDLSDLLINNIFAGAKRDIEIVKASSFDPINESSTDQTFNGSCIVVGFDKSALDNQLAQNSNIKLIIKASEVPFELNQGDCTIKVQMLDPQNDADLGMKAVTINKLMIDGLDAVYKVYGKY